MIDINTIGVGVETKEVVTATRQLDSFGKSAESASRKADGLTTNTQKLGKESGFAAIGLGKLAGGLSAIAAVTSLSRTIDEYTKFNAQLKLATRSQEEYARASADVNRIATTAQASISAIGTLYARLNNSLRDLGATQDQVAKVTENVGLALKVSGATASETASAMLQLSQAFGSGVLRGEEFNAVNEAAPALMRELADSMGVPIGALRELASNGQITSDVLLEAFGNDELLSKFRQQAKEVETISGAVTNLSNRFTNVIGKINEATGASTALIGVLRGVEILLSAFEGGEKGSRLRTFLDDLAASKQKRFDAMSTPQLRILSQYDSEAKKQLDARVKQQQTPKISGLNPDGNIAPNFNATVVVQDVDKIHKKQEEAARRLAESQKKYAEANDKIKEAATKKRLGELELEYTTEALNYEKILEKIEEADKAKAKSYKYQLKVTAMLQEQANKNFNDAQKAYKDAEEEKLREFEKTVDGIDQVFREGFAGLINGGKGSWKSFTQSLLTTFKTTVADQIYKLFAQPFVVKLVASILGVGVSGGASASSAVNSITGGGGGGFGGLFGSVKSLFSGGNAAIISGIEGIGASIANGLGGLRDTIGGFVGANAGMIANVSAFAGAALSLLQGDIRGAAFQGAGAGIGLALGGPIGGAIGSFLGGAIGSLFGGGKKSYNNLNAQTSYQNGVLTQGALANNSRGPLATGSLPMLNGIAKVFGDSLGSLFKAFDLSDALKFSFSIKFGKQLEAGILTTLSNGKTAGPSFTNYGDNSQEAVNRFIEAALSQGILNAIKLSDLSDGIKKFFNGLTKSEDVADTINTLVGFKNALKDLPPIFEAIQKQIDTTAYTTSIAGLKAQFQAIGTFTSLFYSEAENFATFTEQLNTQLASINETLPTSRDAYRQLVDSIEVVDEATRNQFFGLVSLAPIMDVYFKQLEKQQQVATDAADAIRDMNEALAENLNKDLFSTYADYASARVNVANGLSASGFIGERTASEKDSALALEVKSLREQGATQQTILEAIASYLYNMEKIYKQWNGDGLPAERVI